jgi:glycosyltransferase involved in cell wall biosynthesis
MEMSVALCFEGRVADELRGEGVFTTILGGLGGVRLRRPDSVWRARQALTSLLGRNCVDVVVCHQSWPLVIFGKVIRAAGVPTVLWVHTPDDGSHWLSRWALRNQPDCIVCNSEFTMSRLPRVSSRVEYIYSPAIDRSSPVDLEERARIRRELGTAPESVVIVQVSRMEALKGQSVCIDALARLRELPGWTCWQVGGAQQPAEERYFEELRDAAARFGIADRIRFVGERSDIPRLLSAADIYCQPNTEPESFGLTFVEALSAGLPIVTSAMGGALEIVNDACGVLVPPCDPAPLATALRRLVEDSSLRAKLGRHALARRKELCDPSAQMRRIATLLEEVSWASV